MSVIQEHFTWPTCSLAPHKVRWSIIFAKSLFVKIIIEQVTDFFFYNRIQNWLEILSALEENNDIGLRKIVTYDNGIRSELEFRKLFLLVLSRFFSFA